MIDLVIDHIKVTKNGRLNDVSFRTGSGRLIAVTVQMELVKLHYYALLQHLYR